MALWDWIIVVAYVICAVAFGVYFTKRASRSTADFFVAGRSLPWYIAGTSIVAGTFSSDAPLMVAGMSRDLGISSNWFWWSIIIGNVATVFFFAKFWRRTEIITEIEFITQRYQPSKAVSVLRIFRVLNDGVLINSVTMASVTLAMAKILKILLHLSDEILFTIPFIGGVNSTALILLVLGAAILVYTILAGLYGVAYLDTIQFILAMIGAIALAVIVYINASGGEGLMAKLTTAPDFKKGMLGFFPDMSTFSLPVFAFFVYISIAWWGQSTGGMFIVQRLLACRSEKDSVLAFLWYTFCNYVLRTWPWVLVGVVSLHYFPKASDPDMVYPQMIDKFLPVGLKGVMVASLLAAFMSTIDTLLNWGTSYAINDLYKPFLCKNKSQKHYVLASRIATLLLTLIALVVATKLSGIFAAYKYICVIIAGMGPLMILRWYWWRVNAWSEISAILACLIVGNILVFYLPDSPGRELFCVRLVILIAVATPIWVVITLLTSKQPSEKVIEFYQRIRPSGPGWKTVADTTGIPLAQGELANNFVGWISCSIFITCLMLGIGKLLFHEWMLGAINLGIAIICGLIMKNVLGKIQFLGRESNGNLAECKVEQ